MCLLDVREGGGEIEEEEEEVEESKAAGQGLGNWIICDAAKRRFLP